MELKVRDVAKLLKVTEDTVYNWIEHGMIPAHKLHDQYRFNRAELLEWATRRNITLAPELFQEANADEANLPTVYDALESGGIYYGIKGSKKSVILQTVVEKLPLLKEKDREFVLNGLLAREALASTGVGEGIAIPHVRNPIVLNVQSSLVSLCFLEKPVDFESLDGKPVQCLFTLISPTIRTHLHLLSNLAFVLRDSQFKKLLLQQAKADELLKRVREIGGISKNAATDKKKSPK